MINPKWYMISYNEAVTSHFSFCTLKPLFTIYKITGPNLIFNQTPARIFQNPTRIRWKWVRQVNAIFNRNFPPVLLILSAFRSLSVGYNVCCLIAYWIWTKILVWKSVQAVLMEQGISRVFEHTYTRVVSTQKGGYCVFSLISSLLRMQWL